RSAEASASNTTQRRSQMGVSYSLSNGNSSLRKEEFQGLHEHRVSIRGVPFRLVSISPREGKEEVEGTGVEYSSEKPSWAIDLDFAVAHDL
ncbi:hypothetical protein ADUPG1_002301, partial [Aduncisulcus paluster]